MKVLITGANGFIAYHLVKQSLDRNYTVYAGIRKGADVSHLKEFNVEVVELDYTSETKLTECFQNYQFDYIIHAAGTTKAESQEQYNKVNEGYTQNIINALEKVRIKRFVLLSSLAALGPQAYSIEEPIQENSTPKPVTRYGKSKQLGEEIVLKNKSIPWSIVRPTAVYGPREKDFLVLLKTVKYGLETYIGRNPQKLTFVYVEDLVEATLLTLEKEEAIGKTFLISDGNVYDKYAFSDEAAKILDKSTLKIHLPLGVVRILAKISEKVSSKTPVLNEDKVAELIAESWDVTIENAQNILNYQPKYNLERGLKKTIGWYKLNEWI